MSRARNGICQLTGSKGNFVKCHIIPKSITRPYEPGLPLLESTSGNGAKRKWDSWYDQHMVIRKGEDLLRDIDTTGIQELRKHKLIWSGWRDGKFDIFEMGADLPNHGYRQLDGLDHNSLWLFFASIAWRASVSTLKEMSYFKLSPAKEESLKSAILSGSPSFRRHPITLTQMSTLGPAHNQTPTLDLRPDFDSRGNHLDFQPIARIYANGIVSHILLSDIEPNRSGDKSLFLGFADTLIVPCIEFEASAQKIRLEDAISQTFS